MRKLVVGALVGVLTLAVAAIAVAATRTSGTTEQSFTMSATSKRTEASTGVKFETSSTDPQNTAKNQQPKRVTNFDITFPRGTKIDSAAIPQCTATEEDFAGVEDPDDACPPGSKIGDGTVAARTPFPIPGRPGTGDFGGVVTAYNGKKGLVLFVNVQEANQTLVLYPKWRGTKLLTGVPLTCVPPNRPDQDCRPNGTGEPQEAILTKFTLNTRARRGSGKKRKRVLIRTPKTCPRGGWQFTANITYADGSKLKIPSEKSPCRS